MSLQVVDEAFVLHLPSAQKAPVLFSSPHSGREYRENLLRRSILDARQIRSSEDAFVDLLFEKAPAFGAPLLAACVPRAIVDLNRAVDELDPAVIEGIARNAQNPRVSSGLGVIPRVVARGRAIYTGKLTRAEAESRLQTYWHPYHRMLRQQIEGMHRRFGRAALIDCHSMPHEAVSGYSRGGGGRPDVVLGDRFGASASAALVAEIEDIFVGAGLRVARNSPFAGGYITQAWGRPSQGVHAVQLEIDRALYMDEVRIEPRPDFAQFQALISGVVQLIIEMMAREYSQAAE